MATSSRDSDGAGDPRNGDTHRSVEDVLEQRGAEDGCWERSSPQFDSGIFEAATLPLLLPVDSRPTVGVVGTTTFQWVWIAASLGFRVVWGWHAHADKLPRWLQVDDSKVTYTTRRNLLTPVDLILCESKMPQWLQSWRLSRVVVGLHRPRFRVPWYRRVKFKHSDLGGLTEQEISCFVCATQQPEQWDPPDPGFALRSAVYSVASDTVELGKPCAPPQRRLLDHPRVLHLGGTVYHGGGLLPKNESARFILPSVYSPTRWVRRELTSHEKLMAYDVPHRIISLESRRDQYPGLLPGRCLQTSLRTILRGLGWMDGGGHFLFPLGPAKNDIQKECVGDMDDAASRDSDAPFQDCDDFHHDGGKSEERVPMSVELHPEQLDNKRALSLTSDEVETKVSTEIKRLKLTHDSDSSDDEAPVDVKAVKHDDAEVDTFRWRKNLSKQLGYQLTERHEDAMNVLRGFVLRWVRRRTTQMFCGWLHTRKAYQPMGVGMDLIVELATVAETSNSLESYVWAPSGQRIYQEWWLNRWNRLRTDILAGRESLTRFVNSSWWEWTDGSRPAHWKWPVWYQDIIRDGLPIWFKHAPKIWVRPQSAPKDPEELRKIKEKLSKVRDRKYVCPGHVKSLTAFFAVPKGTQDIRMVYDGTKSGLNDAIWVPRFRLPTVNNMLRAIDYGTVMSDFDVGEMFLNFILHETMQSLCGIDLTKYFGEGQVLWERWVRSAMGLKSSPYQAVQAILVAKEVVMGDRFDKSNVFRWDRVRLNLPGTENYDPSLPWVSKVRLDDGKIACDLFIYVDDGRVTAPTKVESAKATRQAAAVLNSLGVQEAARKRRWGSRKAGAWAGLIVQTTDDEVIVMVDPEKWLKTKRYIGDILDELKNSGNGKLNRKELERKRGFLIYVTRTYPSMVPYLKGMHLTIDGWRRHRDEEGWKLTKKEIRELGKTAGESVEDEVPEHVTPVKRFRSDMEALQVLTGTAEPPRRRVRGRKIVTVCYGFGDASAVGGCTNFQQIKKTSTGWKPGDRIHYRYGHWCTEVGEASSNYRELINLVEGLELQVREGLLRGSEIFLFTDNSTAEAVYYKGNSTSKKLFALVLRLRRLEMVGELVLHVVHVAGTRMIEEGADGGSRGDLNQGVMAGHSVLEYVPLHKTALEEEPNLRQWITSWWDESYGRLETLTPEGWFTTGHEGGCYLWAPPPAAADVVVEQLAEAIHKRPWSTHVIVVPRIMTGRWRGDMIKETDFWTEIPAGLPWWSASRYEPLTLFISFPLIDSQPWTLRRTPLLEELDRELRKVWKSDHERGWRLLRELLLRARKLRSLPEGVVRKMLFRPSWKSISN